MIIFSRVIENKEFMMLIKNKIFQALTSYTATNILLITYAVVMALATFVESYTDASMARMLVYNSVWFYLLQILLALNFVGVAIRWKAIQRKKWSMLIFHFAFFVILTGAWMTSVFGFEGTLHVREGDTQSKIVSQQVYLSYRIESESDTIEQSFPYVYRPVFGTGFDEKYQLGNQTIEIKQVGKPYKNRFGARSITIRAVMGNKANSLELEQSGGHGNISSPVLLTLDGVKIWLSFGPKYLSLPFDVKLLDFRLERYPGSRSPSSFESDLEITVNGNTRKEEVYMNKVVHQSGYRLYQSSYDADEQGTILSVNSDYWGTKITYAGYILLAIGIFLILFGKNSRFRELNRKLKTLTSTRLSILLLLLSLFAVVESKAYPEIKSKGMINYVPDKTHAEKFGHMLIQCPTGRIEPMNTYSAKLLRKIYREENFQNYTSDQVVLGMLAYPNYWNMVKFIRQTNKELNRMLGTIGGNYDGKYVSFYDLFDMNGKYKLSEQVSQIYKKPVKSRSKLEKDILKLDEKMNLIYALQTGRLMSLFPLQNDASHKWYSYGDNLSQFSGRDSVFITEVMPQYLNAVAAANISGNWSEADEGLLLINTFQQMHSTDKIMNETSVNAELLYNKLGIFGLLSKIYLLLGLSLLGLSIFAIFRNTVIISRITKFAIGLLIVAFAMHTGGIALRWYISGQAPWSNAYESMVYIGWASAFAGLLFMKRSPMTMALASFLAGLILFVANLNFMDPEITPLVPVLKSYWLMIHVAVITASYGFFGMSFLIGLLSMVFYVTKSQGLKWQNVQSELRLINELSLTIGLCLLTAGTFIGAVWANESWGRYWGWDPKETWALITMIVYAIVLHARFIPRFKSDFAFSVMSVYAILSVLMTYFGVNYYLSGLHSYGKGDTPPALDVVYIIFGIITLLAFIGWQKRQKQKL